MNTTSVNLVDQLKKGNESAYYQLFENYFEPLTFYANSFTEDVETAKDIVQEVMGQLYEKRAQLQISTSLKSYLYQTVKNKSLNHLKHLKVVSKNHEEIKGGQNESYENLDMEGSELLAKINRILEELPPQCATIFKMSKMEGKSNQEIADELGISKKTVENQLSRALSVFRKILTIITLYFILKYS